MEDLVLIQLSEAGCMVEPCGSRITCDPAPTDTDADFLVEFPKRDFEKVIDIIMENGFHPEGTEHYRDTIQNFQSWRLGTVNLLITDKPEWASKHRVATALCKRLNLLNKEDRIALFQAVLYGAQYP